jgi:hypothetical protein
MISVQRHIDELHERMDTAVKLIDETHQNPASPNIMAPGAISREARGLSIVLLFAAYEYLLKSLTRTLLEGAVRCRVGNRRLQPGFRALALKSVTDSVRARPPKQMFKSILPDLALVTAQGGSTCTIETGTFPDDGSFMKTSQIQLWCQIFNVGSPAAILTRTWASVDAIVAQRNAIAHGAQTPDAIGRGYTENEIRDLIEAWRDDWTGFLRHVELLAASRDFFRLPR